MPDNAKQLLRAKAHLCQTAQMRANQRIALKRLMMTNRSRITGPLLGVLISSACGGSSTDSPTSPSTPAPFVSGSGISGNAADLAFCVEETNRYRAMVGALLLNQTAALETIAAAAARADSMSGVAHQYFETHRTGAVLAENELLRLSLRRFGSVRQLMIDGIAAFWSEGPTGGHYQNMAGRYTQLGCGIFIDGDAVTVVQDFR